MNRAVGSRIGTYEIVALLGAGGMGEVYRARDTRLGRDVALKLLPATYALDRDRRARFEREAQMLAALNHPHIAAIYGFEDADTPALVMELVEGPTLADRIAEGRVPVPETIAIARQLALALDAAHERGIVHRDLKPANIKVTADGSIRVLDFGLAKAVSGDGSSALDIANSPTVSVMGTAAGVILGTAAYMSPEQARGQSVDKRTDIWAFGCVLFEMLTGRRAFAGSTISDVIAAILTQEPNWPELPSSVHSPARDLLRRCLEKDPKKRLRDIGDAFVDTPPAPERRPVHMAWLAALAAIAAALGAATGVFVSRPRPVVDSGLRPNETVATRLTEYGGSETSPALSPDGRTFVFISDHGGTPDIWLRQVAGGEPVRLTNDPTPESDLIYAPTASRCTSRAPTSTASASGRPASSAAGPAESSDKRARPHHRRMGGVWPFRFSRATGSVWSYAASTTPRAACWFILFPEDRPAPPGRQIPVSCYPRRVVSSLRPTSSSPI